MYDRLFDRSETHSVHLYGLKGDDQFVMEESARPGIRLRMYGNEGKDQYEIRGRAKNQIIDDEK
jgi:hypothetical protein